MNRLRLVHRNTLSCEPILRRMENGEMLCVSQCGDVTEPAPGNRVYKASEVLDTFVYRISFGDNKYAVGTAADLLQSVIGLIFVMTANQISRRFDQEVL